MVQHPSIFSFVYVLLFVPFHREGFIIAYTGRYMRNVEFTGGYEIVVPRKVRSDGKFVSHQIPHHFKRSFYTTRPNREVVPDDSVHYRLQIGDEDHHLELQPNHHLVCPDAVLEEHRSTCHSKNCNDENYMKNVKLQRIRDSQCHYQGHVHGQTEKSALSTCYGLAGYIRTKRSWYTIEPLEGYDFTKEEEHPHVVYKKKPDEVGTDCQMLCNVTGSMSKSITKRAFDSQKDRCSAKEARSYTLELLLVVDKSVLDFRKDFDVENYVLTLLNMAAGLLHDVSLGILMELSIVRIIRMQIEDEEMNLAMTRDSNKTLKYFQEWQQMINPGDDSHPNHHDCAILLTKSNICDTANLCGFTGTSTIAGTCDPLKGAAVVKDVGLQTGYHLAHQIGHTLGMSHDVQEVNGCPGIIYHGKEYIETTVMYPGSLYITKKWSKCSRKALKSYIEAGLGFCLEDKPHINEFPTAELLPGVMYNADDQCRLEYRPDARYCDMGISCETLWCSIPGKGCVSLNKPLAEGTSCGENRWCYRMKCLMVGERPDVVDGNWSEWSPWSRCSRSCGSGVASSVRRCSNPAPSNGGAYCSGNRKRHRICATNPCDQEAPSFRDVQCAEFNSWIFPEDGKVHRWSAYNLPENLKASENPCNLYCLNEMNVVASLRPKVVDGTTCYRGIRDICVAGVCREIPCDLHMESNAVEDMCGVCRGNGTSCRLKEATVTIEMACKTKKIVEIPIGAVNIRVEETTPTKSRIMVRSKDGKPLIDGDRLGMFDMAGSKAWLGTIRPNQEALNIPGPINRDLVVLVEPTENFTMKYSFGVKEKNPRRPDFMWDFVGWEKCSANCGPGEQVSKPRCLERVAGQVDETFCKNIPKPEAKVRPCHQAPCLPRWMIGDWQGCMPSLLGYERTRAVKCVRPVGNDEQDVDIIADSYCQGPKPKKRESCKGREKRAEDNDDGDDDDDDDVLTQEKMSKKNQQVVRQSCESETEANQETTEPQIVMKGEVVIDKEDVKNLTLTIVLRRDEETGVLNFPKNFEPRPPTNATEFTLVGMDAIRYIQKIQEEAGI